MNESEPPFWERPEQVEKFASRDPDHRLRELVERFDDPPAVRVLDLGCAGGRNTRFLAREGFDVWALDASEAMVAETRRRLSPVLGRDEAARRVRLGWMDDLRAYPAGHFDVVVALGVYHNASHRREWDRALSETVRVLAPGGLLLVSNFAPGTDLTGEGMERVEGTAHVYRGAPSGLLTLLPAEALDEEMARRGLRPVEETRTSVVEKEGARRVTVNGLYRAESAPNREGSGPFRR